jgi:transcription elongation factor Elf1
MIEHFFGCPYCGAEISVLLDPTVTTQQYVEDCEVCCNPMDVSYTIEEAELIGFDAVSIEQ